MRTVVIAAAALAGMAAGGAADAQGRMVMPGPGPGMPAGRPGPAPAHDPASFRGQHWGGQYGGHWIGGMRAPGGWGAYRRPGRGTVLPGYWVSSGFAIGDWAGYGLPQPPYGYGWSRYYDDAVLIDGRGTVYDSVGDIDWRRYDLDEAQGGRMDAYLANRDSFRDGPGAPYGYPAPGGYDEGYAPRGRQGRDLPPAPAYAPPPSPGPGFAPPVVVQGGGGAIVTTSSVGGAASGTWVNGYYYPPAAVTTVTVASAPVVTTTTEVFEDNVTYTRPAVRAAVYHPVRRVYRKRVWRPAPACYCR